MEEKERYYIEHDMIIDAEKIINGELDITVCNTDDLETVANLLNQQSNRIKELENDIVNYKYGLSRNSEVYKENQLLKQSQKQLAIEELENLKKEFYSRKLEYKTMENSFHIYGLRIDRIFEIIDDKIKELKGEE